MWSKEKVLTCGKWFKWNIDIEQNQYHGIFFYKYVFTSCEKKKQNSNVGKKLWEAIKSYSIEIFIFILKSSRFSA